MFATIEEAEKAARVVSRITRRRAEVWPEADIGIAVGFADESRVAPGYASWDELAAFLEQGYNPSPPEDERRAGLLAQAKAHLGVAQRLAETQASMTADRCLIATLDCLLEALT